MIRLTHNSPKVSQQILANRMLSHRVPVQRGSWQGENAPSATYELSNVICEFMVPDSISQWQNQCEPDLPWSEEHFQERVGGKALNPTPSYVRWPWHSQKEAERFIREGGKFDHTYPERFWPRDTPRVAEHGPKYLTDMAGDLYDVVALLRKDTWTRQAYLPIFFPEDTGAAFGQRVPCTLGYHFIRNGAQLDCNYFIRSCDLTRHYKNDIYLAGRLLQWILDRVTDKEDFPYPGQLTMFISNLHLFEADKWRFT
jgi:hypothetical protein